MTTHQVSHLRVNKVYDGCTAGEGTVYSILSGSLPEDEMSPDRSYFPTTRKGKGNTPFPSRFAQSEEAIKYNDRKFHISSLPSSACPLLTGVRLMGSQKARLGESIDYLPQYTESDPSKLPKSDCCYTQVRMGDSPQRSGTLDSEGGHKLEQRVLSSELLPTSSSDYFVSKPVLSKKDWSRPLNHNSSNLRFSKVRKASLTKSNLENTKCDQWTSPSATGTLKFQPAVRPDLEESIHQLPTRVLLVKTTGPAKVTIQNLCNLLSNYGNIEIGKKDLDSNHSLVRFTSVEGAALTIKHLNRFNLEGQRLVLSYSSLDIDHLATSSTREQIYVPSTGCRRYRKDIPAQANTVSRTLHVCVFFHNRRRIVRDNEILNIIGIHALHLRMHRDLKKDNLNMWFMEFASIVDATKVLMKCHDLPFDDGNLRISYTKTKRS